MEGTVFDKETGDVVTDEAGRNDTEWQFVLRSEAECNAVLKNDLIRAVGAEKNILSKTYFTAYGGALADTDETTASKADSSYDNIFHIFEKDDNTPYGYIGSVYHDKTSDSYIKVKDVSGISVYHYYLVQDADNGNAICRKVLENEEQINPITQILQQ